MQQRLEIDINQDDAAQPAVTHLRAKSRTREKIKIRMCHCQTEERGSLDGRADDSTQTGSTLCSIAQPCYLTGRISRCLLLPSPASLCLSLSFSLCFLFPSSPASREKKKNKIKKQVELCGSHGVTSHAWLTLLLRPLLTIFPRQPPLYYPLSSLFSSHPMRRFVSRSLPSCRRLVSSFSPLSFVALNTESSAIM